MVEQKTTGENGKDYLVQRQQNPASLDLVPVLKSSIIRNNGHYSIEREEARRILSGESEIIPGSEVLYLSRGNLEEMLSQAKYSPMDLKSYGKKTGKVVFEMKDAEFPASWNENQTKIVAQKYFFKPDKEEWKEKLREKIGREHEYSLKQLINRVTNFIADEGFKLGCFATEDDRDAFADELKFLQVNRKLAFNSPVQFNAGIFNEYDVSGSPGIGFWRNP